MNTNLTIYCDHVNNNHVHCDKCTYIDIEPNQTMREAVEASRWTMDDDGNIYCKLHS